MADSMLQLLQGYLKVTTDRQQLVASNMANVYTPGFRTRYIDFRAELCRASAPLAGTEDEDGLSYASRSAEPYEPVVLQVHGLLERPDGNNVSVERESLLLAETQMKFNLGVQLLKDQFHGISQAINSGGTSS